MGIVGESSADLSMARALPRSRTLDGSRIHIDGSGEGLDLPTSAPTLRSVTTGCVRSPVQIEDHPRPVTESTHYLGTHPAEGSQAVSDLTRALLGTRGRLLSVVALLFVLIVVVPIALLVVGFPVPAAVSVLVGLVGLAALVMALLPGRRRWR